MLGFTFDDIQIIPNYSDIESRSHCDTRISFPNGVEMLLPIFSAPMDTVTEGPMVFALMIENACGIIHRFLPVETIDEQLESLLPAMDTSLLGIAIGLKDYQERVELALKYKAAFICIDTANGHNSNVEPVIKDLIRIRNKSNHNFLIMAGNICTNNGASYLCDLGVDAIRVGVGSGSACKTRVTTAIGVPQATAILAARDGINKSSNPNCLLISDGGIKNVGDICKALALGANAVMLGSLLAGTDESPGKLITNTRYGGIPDPSKYEKVFRGSASLESKQERGDSTSYIEGISTKIPYKGSVDKILQDIKHGLQSSMAYVGARNLIEFNQKAKIIPVSHASQREAFPHILLENK